MKTKEQMIDPRAAYEVTDRESLVEALRVARDVIRRNCNTFTVMSRCRNNVIPVAITKEVRAVPRLKPNEPHIIEHEIEETPAWLVAERQITKLCQALTLINEVLGE